ncbi:MAG: 16S rRNA (cytosine(1402)-N(4))-methyltransferase RsmH [Ignavibacteria bacterium]|nr:16S rRNA (cytosine(1402)-N(4))-methyltransferase RsmH [Ignavibacteria bacterium]
MNDEFYHEPVLVNETIDFLLGKSGADLNVVVDCTLGGGGYTKKILEDSPGCKVIGIDRDVYAISHCRSSLAKYSDRLMLVQDNFRNIKEVIRNSGFEHVSGIMMDLGLSTYQLISEDGFSYQRDTSLDMRADKDQRLTANDVVNKYSEKELAKIFYEYGELKYGRQIAKNIVLSRKNREFSTTFDIVDMMRELVPPRYLNSDLSKLFQAIRIEVNAELVNLAEVLEDSSDVLETGARVAVVSYHSLEDRIVKNAFRSSDKLKVITKKPVEAAEEEITANTKARSAKLRAAEKI